MTAGLLAPAKINLTLKITGRRNDGYHTLISHVVFTNFGDELSIDIAPSKAPQITIKCSGEFASDVPKDNTLTHAFDLFCAHYNIQCKVIVNLVKNLPSRAGLGSGSSDAATLLRALFDHFKPDQNDKSLYHIAQKIGADVPVCLRQKPTLMRGMGEILEDFSPQDLGLEASTHIVLIWPGAGETTQILYENYDNLSNKNIEFDNDFMAVAPPYCPAIHDAIAYLEQSQQCFKIGLSGSGSTVFGLSKKPFDPAPHDFLWLKTGLIKS